MLGELGKGLEKKEFIQELRMLESRPGYVTQLYDAGAWEEKGF